MYARVHFMLDDASLCAPELVILIFQMVTRERKMEQRPTCIYGTMSIKLENRQDKKRGTLCNYTSFLTLCMIIHYQVSIPEHQRQFGGYRK